MIDKATMLDGLGKYHKKIKPSLGGGAEYSDFGGATKLSGGVHGLVPAPEAGDDEKFLRGDGTWVSVSGGDSIAIAALSGAIDIFRAEIFSLDDRITALETIDTDDIAKLPAKVSELDGEVDIVKADVEVLRISFDNFNADAGVDELREKFSSLNGTVDELESDVQILADRLVAAESAVVAVGDDVAGLSRAIATLGGGSAGGLMVLDTVPVTVDGGLWYEFDDDNKPVIKLRSGNYIYDFNSGTAKYAGGNSNLVSFLPFDSSATADVCGVTWAVQGTATIDTDNKKFGAASLKLESNILYAQNVIDLNASAWTFDCWVYLPEEVNHIVWFGKTAPTNAATTGVEWFNNGIRYGYNGSWSKFAVFKNGVPTSNVWHHFALVRNGDKVNAFVDGVLESTLDITGIEFNETYFCLSRASFDNVRFFKDVALWTSDFTPPTAEDYD